MTTRVCFISDLHLFTTRTEAGRYRDRIHAAAHQADALVLGGDIFDFKWSTYADERTTADAAVTWLEQLCTSLPASDVHFLLGNHDDNHVLRGRLPRLEAMFDHFDWHRYFVRMGDTIFLHGDCADRPRMTAAKLERRRSHPKYARRADWRHEAYRVFLKARVDQLVPRAVYPKRRIAKRIGAYLDSIGQGASSGVEHVYFGHTHVAFRDFHRHGLTFHNPGAPIGQSRFQILELTVNGIPDDDMQAGNELTAAN